MVTRSWTVRLLSMIMGKTIIRYDHGHGFRIIMDKKMVKHDHGHYND